MRRLSHTPAETVGAAIARAARALRRARVHFGHGTDNARDEAAELVFYAAGLGHDLGAAAYPTKLNARRAARIDALLEQRIAERIPLAYLTHRSFFAGLELYVDELEGRTKERNNGTSSAASTSGDGWMSGALKRMRGLIGRTTEEASTDATNAEGMDAEKKRATG